MHYAQLLMRGAALLLMDCTALAELYARCATLPRDPGRLQGSLLH
jgi:hypothetical protein